MCPVYSFHTQIQFIQLLLNKSFRILKRLNIKLTETGNTYCLIILPSLNNQLLNGGRTDKMAKRCCLKPIY